MATPIPDELLLAAASLNVLSWGKWRELCRRPLEGSKPLRLWHISETRPLSLDELAGKGKPKAKGSATIHTLTPK
jgi:hypothetical protein